MNKRGNFNSRIYFYRSAEDFKSNKPAFVVFYISVPDTVPEYKTEKEIIEHFNTVKKKLMR